MFWSNNFEKIAELDADADGSEEVAGDVKSQETRDCIKNL